MAAACRERAILGASFFSSRDSAERSNIHLIFPTIADQLGRVSDLFRAELRQIVQLNPHIGSSSPPFQLEELIIKPLHAIGKSFPSCVIILDALDECKDAGTTSVILTSLSHYIKDLPLKFLITSRPDQNITSVFNYKSNKLATATQRLVLHEIALATVEPDILLYIESNLVEIGAFYALNTQWASERDIQALTKQAFGLFIFAATSVKFIADQSYRSPKEQLVALLEGTKTAEISSSPYHHLDKLYKQVLTSAFPDVKKSLKARLKMILGSIVLLQDPLSSTSLECLLKLQPNTVLQTLGHLHSTILVPENDIQPIRLLHPSFVDFLTDPKRCDIASFAVNSVQQHTLLAHACLDTMKMLKKDICQIKNASILNNEVGDLSSKMAKYIPSHLLYACRHWAIHFTHSLVSDSLLDLTKEVCMKYLLYWIEVCSHIGELRNALLAVHSVKEYIMVCS